MGQARNLLRGLTFGVGEPPAAILTSLDKAMRHFTVDSLATAILAQVEQTATDAATGRRRVRWSNAGHPPPLLVASRRVDFRLAGNSLSRAKYRRVDRFICASAAIAKSSIDPRRCALVLVDYQARLMPAIHEGDKVVAAALKLADVARELSIPVVGTEQKQSRPSPGRRAVQA